MIISRTPFRLSFFGGGTDYPEWYRQHGGAVLATTIDKYCYLSCRYLPPFFDYRYRVVWSKVENCRSLDEIEHPVVRCLLGHLGITRGLEVHHVGDLPARSGMGSSSSFTVGLLHALHALQGRMVGKSELAQQAIAVEQELLGETVGSQDQVSAAHGGFNKITFAPDGHIEVSPMVLPTGRVAELDAHLMLFYTGIVRTASKVAATYVTDLHGKRRQLRILRDMVDESIDLLAGGPFLFLFLAPAAVRAARTAGRRARRTARARARAVPLRIDRQPDPVLRPRTGLHARRSPTRWPGDRTVPRRRRRSLDDPVPHRTRGPAAVEDLT